MDRQQKEEEERENYVDRRIISQMIAKHQQLEVFRLLSLQLSRSDCFALIRKYSFLCNSGLLSSRATAGVATRFSS